MKVVPFRFLVHVTHRCPHVADLSLDGDESITIPESGRLDPLGSPDGFPSFADVRLGWNDGGLGMIVEVRGKDAFPLGDVERPGQSDGITLWIDTRGDRTSHRALRTCHQFHFAAAGAGADKSEPFFAQTKIHRAIHDAPIADPSAVSLRRERIKGGYRLEAFISSAALSAYNPEEHPVLGVCYRVRDLELGDQQLVADVDFPISDDPSLWASLELVK